MSIFHEVSAWDLQPFEECLGGRSVEYVYAITRKGEAALFVRKGLKVDRQDEDTEWMKTYEGVDQRSTRTLNHMRLEISPDNHVLRSEVNDDGIKCDFMVSHFDCGDRLKPLDPAACGTMDEIVCRFLALLRRLR